MKGNDRHDFLAGGFVGDGVEIHRRPVRIILIASEARIKIGDDEVFRVFLGIPKLVAQQSLAAGVIEESGIVFIPVGWFIPPGQARGQKQNSKYLFHSVLCG